MKPLVLLPLNLLENREDSLLTFHTGDIFTSEMLKQIVAPFSGKTIVPKSLKTISYRKSHGAAVSKLQQEVS